MIQLRGGLVTTDPRLDRLPQNDIRSLKFPISAVVPADIKSKRWRLDARLDQGMQGQCVSYAFHHEACAMPVVRKRPTGDQLRDRYYDMQRRDPWEGGEYPGAAPAYGGTSLLAGAQIMKDAGFFSEYRWAFGLDDILRAITHEGPVVLALDWYETMFNPDERGLIRVGGGIAGGHAILARGSDLRREEIILRNSWGIGHGVLGDVRIGFEDLSKLMREGGEACVPINRK